MFMIITKEIDLGQGKTISIETGKNGKTGRWRHCCPHG